jgi:hypothetical protein
MLDKKRFQIHRTSVGVVFGSPAVCGFRLPRRSRTLFIRKKQNFVANRPDTEPGYRLPLSSSAVFGPSSPGGRAHFPIESGKMRTKNRPSRRGGMGGFFVESVGPENAVFSLSKAGVPRLR